jgi:hypothetical protein
MDAQSVRKHDGDRRFADPALAIGDSQKECHTTSPLDVTLHPAQFGSGALGEAGNRRMGRFHGPRPPLVRTCNAAIFCNRMGKFLKICRTSTL